MSLTFYLDNGLCILGLHISSYSSRTAFSHVKLSAGSDLTPSNRHM